MYISTASEDVFIEVTGVHVCQTVLWQESAGARLPPQSPINPLGCKAAQALHTAFSLAAAAVCPRLQMGACENEELVCP